MTAVCVVSRKGARDNQQRQRQRQRWQRTRLHMREHPQTHTHTNINLEKLWRSCWQWHYERTLTHIREWEWEREITVDLCGNMRMFIFSKRKVLFKQVPKSQHRASNWQQQHQQQLYQIIQKSKATSTRKWNSMQRVNEEEKKNSMIWKMMNFLVDSHKSQLTGIQKAILHHWQTEIDVLCANCTR